MTDDVAADIAALRAWAAALNTVGLVQAAQVLRLIAFAEAQARLCVEAVERCRAQAELLSKRAERGAPAGPTWDRTRCAPLDAGEGWG